MTRNELVRDVAKRAGVSQLEVSRVVNATVESMVSELSSGNKVVLTGFGTFYTAMRASKVGRNIRTGESVSIPPTVVVRFKPGQLIKRGVKPTLDD